MKKITFCILMLLWICSNIQIMGQGKEPQIREDGAYMYVDQLPVYPGREAALMEFMAKNLKYPEDAKVQGISGRVIVQFVVKKNGELTSFKVVRGIHPSLDAEALRAIKSIPKRWIPGRDKGEKVNTVFNIPVNFQLPTNNSNLGDQTIQKSDAKAKSPLQGVWQLCREVVPVGQGQFRIQTAPYMKILSSDMNFINMYVGVMNDRSVITALGTYKQTSNDTYVESVYKSVSDPELTGIENKLNFVFLTNDLLQITYQIPGRPTGGREIWVRVVQPSER